MRLPKDILSGRAKKPEFYLCRPDKTILGGLNVTNASATFKFNSYGEISCELYRTYQHPISGEMVVNPLYDKIEALMLLYIVNFGYFQIQESNEIIDSSGERKSISAYSLEYALCQRYLDNFLINLGVDGSIDGVKLLNQADISHSLIHLALEKMPNWSVGHVDLSVQDRQRSFEVDHQTIYDFLLNDVSDTFGVIFEFDTVNNTVNIYDEETYSLDSNIYVSMDTIANSVEISYNADDIKTRLYVYGADEPAILAMIKENPALGEKISEKYDYTVAEVLWAIRHEMALTVDDVLARRVRLLFVDAREAQKAAPRVAQILAEELGRDQAWIDEQVASFTELASHYYVA